MPRFFCSTSFSVRTISAQTAALLAAPSFIPFTSKHIFMLNTKRSTILYVCWCSIALLALCAAAAVGDSATSSVASTSTSTPLAALSPTTLRVIYIGFRDVNYNDGGATIRAAVDAGYNTVILAFWLFSGTNSAPMFHFAPPFSIFTSLDVVSSL